MERITDKTKRKNWIDGDTFAVKIENYSDKYNGKYLILIKSVNDIWKKDFESKDEFNFSDFIYIGNYKFDCPKNEFIPYRWVELTSYYTKFDWIKNLIDDYENYNLRKSSHFTPEGSKRFADKYKGNVIFVEEFLKLSKLEMKKTKEIYLYGLGPKLYDAGLALEIRTDYRKYMRKNKKTIKNNKKIQK